MDLPGWSVIRGQIADVAVSFFTGIDYLENLPLSELSIWHEEAKARAPKKK